MKKVYRISTGLHLHQPPERTVSEAFDLAKCYDSLISQISTKLSICETNAEKTNLLTLLPSCFTVEQCAEKTGCSEYLIRKAKEICQEKGILPKLQKKRSGNQLPQSTLNLVKNWYESDDNSRQSPNACDCIFIKNEKGERERIAKRMLLFTEEELHLLFRRIHPEIKIGRSKFASLRPKHCILPSDKQTLEFCVCKYHQNVKLRIKGANLKVDYKDLMKRCVCSTENEACMTSQTGGLRCSSCPDLQALRDELINEIEQETEEVTFWQWIADSTDGRPDLKKITETVAEYVDELVKAVQELCRHHFIWIKQNEFFNWLKLNLKEAIELLIVMDYAENYSCRIQKAIQAQFFNMRQATLHNFVVYYIKDGKCQHISFCLISDYLKHDNFSTHVFLSHLIRILKEDFPILKKLFIFTDGGPAHYKNKSNLGNLCFFFP